MNVTEERSNEFGYEYIFKTHERHMELMLGTAESLCSFDTCQVDDYTTFIEQWEKGLDPILRNAPHLVIIHAPDDWIWSSADSVIALTQFELAAVARGIGTCWAGFLMRAANGHPPVREALGIPADHSVFGALMFGFPRYRYHRIPARQGARIERR
jgi:nitroreductase